jgi:hypothetical protein
MAKASKKVDKSASEKQRVNIDLPLFVISELQNLADLENRDRKNYIETILINHVKLKK